MICPWPPCFREDDVGLPDVAVYAADPARRRCRTAVMPKKYPVHAACTACATVGAYEERILTPMEESPATPLLLGADIAAFLRRQFARAGVDGSEAPIVVNPRTQGWIFGFAHAVADGLA